MDLTLPLLGDVMTEGTVTEWFQADGAYVREGEPLYQVETDKVNLTVDAPQSGTLERVVSEGETVPVGAVVGRLVAVASVATAPSPVALGVSSASITPAAGFHADAQSRTAAAEAGGEVVSSTARLAEPKAGPVKAGPWRYGQRPRRARWRANSAWTCAALPTAAVCARPTCRRTSTLTPALAPEHHLRADAR